MRLFCAFAHIPERMMTSSHGKGRISLSKCLMFAKAIKAKGEIKASYMDPLWKYMIECITHFYSYDYIRIQ